MLALVSVTAPGEGQEVHGSFGADGVASSFEGTEPIDVADLAPGRYTFEASTDDPSGGEVGGPTTDTRTVVVT